jgi:hypothetical protein
MQIKEIDGRYKCEAEMERDSKLARKVNILLEHYTPLNPDKFLRICRVLDGEGRIDSDILEADGLGEGSPITIRTLAHDDIRSELQKGLSGSVFAYDWSTGRLVSHIPSPSDLVYISGKVTSHNSTSSEVTLLKKPDRQVLPVLDEEGKVQAEIDSDFTFAADPNSTVVYMAMPHVTVSLGRGLDGNMEWEVTDSFMLHSRLRDAEVSFERLEGNARRFRNLKDKNLGDFILNLSSEESGFNTELYQVLSEMAPYIPDSGTISALEYRDRAEGDDRDVAHIFATKLRTDPKFRSHFSLNGHVVTIENAEKWLEEANACEAEWHLDWIKMANTYVTDSPSYAIHVDVIKRLSKALSGRGSMITDLVDTPDKAVQLYVLAACDPKTLDSFLDALDDELISPREGFREVSDSISTATSVFYFDKESEHYGDKEKVREEIGTDISEFLYEALREDFMARLPGMIREVEEREWNAYVEDVLGDELDEYFGERYEKEVRPAVERDEQRKLVEKLLKVAELNEMTDYTEEALREDVFYEQLLDMKAQRKAKTMTLSDSETEEARRKFRADYHNGGREREGAEIAARGGIYNKIKGWFVSHSTAFVEPDEKQLKPYLEEMKLEKSRRAVLAEESGEGWGESLAEGVAVARPPREKVLTELERAELDVVHAPSECAMNGDSGFMPGSMLADMLFKDSPWYKALGGEMTASEAALEYTKAALVDLPVGTVKALRGGLHAIWPYSALVIGKGLYKGTHVVQEFIDNAEYGAGMAIALASVTALGALKNVWDEASKRSEGGVKHYRK